jgi:hypothetical protein
MALGATSSVSYRYRSRIDSGCRNGAQAADTAVQGGNNKNQRREGKVVTVKIGDMCWPLPDSDLEYRLRHCQDQITGTEKMRAAAILSAYAQMIKMTRDARQKVISAIRLDQNRRKRWGQLDTDGELEHGEQHGADGELEHGADGELEKIRQLLRELSNRVKAVPLRNIIVEEERE